MTVAFTAAHGGFAAEAVPLGGGAAIAELLTSEWRRTAPFDTLLLTPDILGERAPRGRDLVSFGERQYAAFCRDFERATTAAILAQDPSTTVVLSNDIAEGPDFRALAARGFRVYTIFHVDVVAYVAAIYLRSWFRPRTLARWADRCGRILPDMARLIFTKQRDCIECSRGLIVPSAAMRDVIEDCYEAARDKAHVIPWGVPAARRNDAALEEAVAGLRREYRVPSDALCLLTLSRISPEKGQDLLLDSLLQWERRGDLPQRPLWLFVCGGPAYMQGLRFQRKLETAAEKLRRIRVVFPGHVTGVRKRAFFELADIYVFPSRHESYGLTLLEALQAGLPAVCLDHHGAKEIMRPEFGRLVSVEGLVDAIVELASDPTLRERMAEAARAYASTQSFSCAASQLAGVLMEGETALLT